MPERSAREPLIDRYRKIRRRFGIDEIAHSLRSLDEELRFGDGESSVLGEQLAEARRHGAEERERLGREPPHLLILTVGASPEPLLLAVAFHAPRDLALLETVDLGQKARAALVEVWDEHCEALGIFPFDDDRLRRRVVAADPAPVFQAVRDLAGGGDRREGDVVLDISGAKKSMIAGSFLAAGYLDLEATYVDFKDYDPVLRRPEPGTSHLRSLPNPYRLFRLKERQRLARAFDQRHYGEVQELLEDLLASLTKDEVVSVLGEASVASERRHLEALRQVSRVYLDWSEGFYADACAASRKLAGLDAPPTVELLAEIWPRRDRPAAEIVGVLDESAFFRKPAWALAYLCDLLIWCDPDARAKNSRACYLRLFGGIEALVYLTFHVFACRNDGDFRLDLEAEPVRAFAENLALEEFALEGRWFEEMTARAIESTRVTTFPALKLLGGGRRLYPEQAIGKISKKLRQDLQNVASSDLDRQSFRSEVEALLAVAWASLARPPLTSDESAVLVTGETGLDAFREIRNKATHWLAPVPPELTAAIRDLFGRFVEILVPKVVAELCRNPGSDDLTDLELWSERLLVVASGAELETGLEPLTFKELARLPDLSIRSQEEVQP